MSAIGFRMYQPVLTLDEDDGWVADLDADEPLTAPFMTAGARGAGLPRDAVCRPWCDVADHAIPAPGCSCGITVTDDPRAVFEYFAAIAPWIQAALSHNRIRMHWHHLLVLAQVVADGPGLPVEEAGFARYGHVRVTHLYVPASLANIAGDLEHAYRIPVLTSASSGLDWFRELCPAFAPPTTACVICRAPAVHGLCLGHSDMFRAELAAVSAAVQSGSVLL